METVAEACRDGESPVAFPDFAHAVINRLKPGGGKEEIAVDLEGILTNGDCSKDMPLEWGDVVQIPQLDHLLNATPEPLASVYAEALTNCLQRHVQIVVKGQTTKLRLLPAIGGRVMGGIMGIPTLPRPMGNPPPPSRTGSLPPMPSGLGGPPGIATHEATPEPPPVEKTLYTFLLSEVVQQANVLLLSSDLSRVKVIRHGVEMSYDIERLLDRSGPRGGGGGGRGGRFTSNNNPSYLWLRDGDVIEIPERDPNAPAGK